MLRTKAKIDSTNCRFPRLSHGLFERNTCLTIIMLGTFHMKSDKPTLKILVIKVDGNHQILWVVLTVYSSSL